MSTKVQPICPKCNVAGIEHITSDESNQQHGTGDAWFHVAYCDQCGHVYGVFAKHTMSPSPKFGF